MLGLVPSITARKCYDARTRLQAALTKYYDSDGDSHPEVAQIVKNRANVLRKSGLGKEAGMFEVALLHVATSNTIPTLYWFVVNVFSRPDLVARLRDELAPVAHFGANGGEVTLNIGSLEDQCPLLVRCYRETMRLSLQGMANRRVMEDTTITDGRGASYLLKKGINVQMSVKVSHSLTEIWGPDAASFDPERFIVRSGKDHFEEEKLKKASFMPFGGGKHLCPGRNFAFAENMGFVASLVLGFDVVPLDEDMMPTHNGPEMAPCLLTGTGVKPVRDGEGYGVRIRRREGWESVKWRYTS